MKNTYYFKNAWGMTRKRASKSVLLMSISFILLMLTGMQGHAQRAGNISTTTVTDRVYINYEGFSLSKRAWLQNLYYNSDQLGIGFYTWEAGVAEWLRMTIAHNGNVGIGGMTSPSSPLHVEAGSSTTPNSNGIYLYQSNTNQHSIISSRVNANGSGDPFFSVDVNGESGWAFGLDNSDGNKFKVVSNWRDLSQNARLTIDRNGNMGIGKTNPSAKLDVVGTGAFSNKLTVAAGGLEVSGASSFNNEVTVNSTFNTDALNVSGASSFNNEVTVNSTFNAGALNVSGASSFNNEVTVNSTFNTGALNVSGASSFDDQVTVNSTFTTDILNVSGSSSFNNNLTVGGSSQAANVRVHGTAEVRELHIDPTETWADHVFEENYELKSLTEVEKFIQENHHLPEVPSAKEVSENGYNQSEINAALLQKIEELTLYMIEQEKQNKALAAEIEALKKRK